MPSLRPPLEVWFIAPLGALVVAITLGTKSTVSSVVIAIVVMGTILAWCSGTTLDLLRTRDRAVRVRAIAHALGALVAVLALGYIEIVREELMPMLIETIRSGPE